MRSRSASGNCRMLQIYRRVMRRFGSASDQSAGERSRLGNLESRGDSEIGHPKGSEHQNRGHDRVVGLAQIGKEGRREPLHAVGDGGASQRDGPELEQKSAWNGDVTDASCELASQQREL